MPGNGSLMRTVLLKLASSPSARRAATKFGPSRRAARRFIAGETLEEALGAVHALNAEGKKATLDYLGENVSTPEEAAGYTGRSVEILRAIARERLDCNISVKLTGMGLDLGVETALANLRKVLAAATEAGSFVRVDMEGSAYTQATIDLFRRARAENGNVGIVLQAYLYRTEKDLADMITLGAGVRLCKGAYQEPPGIAFPEKRDVDASYRKLAGMLLSQKAIARGVRPAIATHDPEMVAEAERLAADRKIPRETFEFQMLYGIRRDLQAELVKKGYTLRIYVPFGEEWYPYFMRRLAERPANVGFVLKNLWRES